MLMRLEQIAASEQRAMSVANAAMPRSSYRARLALCQTLEAQGPLHAGHHYELISARTFQCNVGPGVEQSQIGHQQHSAVTSPDLH
jgi:hypothetical protein